MGVVFRARDTKLQRDVALKLLPDHFASDPDRIARFRQEAQILASLNHPNIAQIHGLEDSGNSSCIVMELVEGETLQDRLKPGPMPLDETLRIAHQIAEGLEAAHERGIIHRDLKPANIKVAPDGKVKILDFGLAAVRETEASPVAASHSPTMVSTPGMIIGTAAYMSPEQARGKTVDKRSDIFSFGCVLYEMLTGRQAFGGEDVPDILSRILQRDPVWSALPPGLSVQVATILRRCLEKDVTNRRRDIGDVRIDIQNAQHELPVAALPSRDLERSRLPWIWPIATGLLAAMLSVATALYIGKPSLEAPEMRVEINTPASRQPLHFALSPDGLQLAFVASGDGAQRLWVRSLGVLTAVPLAGTEEAEFPFWSADGRSIGFFAGGKLKRVDLSGGPPQTLANAPVGRGGSWSGDGTILFSPTGASPLWRVPASGGDSIQVTQLDLAHYGSHRFPQFLPDGRHFIFFAQGRAEEQGIFLGSLDSKDMTRLTLSDTAAAYAAGMLFFNRQGAFIARHLDVSGRTLTGEAVTVAAALGYDQDINIAGFSTSLDGNVAYRPGGLDRRQLTWFDRQGKTVGVAGEPNTDNQSGITLSAAGRRAAIGRTVQNNTDLWAIDPLRGGAERITTDPAQDNLLQWSRDGQRVAFTSNRKGVYNIYLKTLNGTGDEQLLMESPQAKLTMDWSRDDQYLLYEEADAKTGWDLWALPLTGDRKPIPISNTLFEERSGRFSPDGGWVAYQSNETGRFEIYVQPFPGPGVRSKVSTAGGTDPRWRPDGKELFFMAPDGKLMAASVRSRAGTFEAESPAPLFQTRVPTSGAAYLMPQYAVSNDGRFLVNTRVDDAVTPIVLILNGKFAAKK
jgi:serine/threonine protein kinase/dipeptidyl aminopeptidase/acylaminoacyl peptidase